MKNQTIIIYDQDSSYSRNLMDFLNQQENFPFEARMITKEETLIKILGEKPADILLLGENEEKKVWEKKGQCIFQLKETEEGVLEEGDIYKYQSIEGVIHCLMKGKNKITAQDYPVNHCSQKIYIKGIFSPSGGVGKTTLAMELAKIYGKEGRVLYLNFDIIGNSYDREPDFITNYVQELFYRIHEHSLNIEEELETYFSRKGNVYFLGLSPYRQELWNLSREDMAYWMDYIRKSGQFEFVVLDIGFINEGMLELMKGCDDLIVLTGTNPLQKEKNEQFRGMLEFCKEDVIKQKIKEMTCSAHEDIPQLIKKLVV